VNLDRDYSDTTPDVTHTYKRSANSTASRTPQHPRFHVSRGNRLRLDYETLDASFYDTGHILKYKYNAKDRRSEGYIYGVSTTGGASYATKHWT